MTARNGLVVTLAIVTVFQSAMLAYLLWGPSREAKPTAEDEDGGGSVSQSLPGDSSDDALRSTFDDDSARAEFAASEPNLDVDLQQESDDAVAHNEDEAAAGNEESDEDVAGSNTADTVEVRRPFDEKLAEIADPNNSIRVRWQIANRLNWLNADKHRDKLVQTINSLAAEQNHEVYAKVLSNLLVIPMLNSVFGDEYVETPIETHHAFMWLLENGVQGQPSLAAAALLWFRHDDVAEEQALLRVAMADPRPGNRRGAIFTIGRRFGRSALASLRIIAEADTDRLVRIAANEAIQAIEERHGDD